MAFFILKIIMWSLVRPARAGDERRPSHSFVDGLFVFSNRRAAENNSCIRGSFFYLNSTLLLIFLSTAHRRILLLRNKQESGLLTKAPQMASNTFSGLIEPL